MRIIQSLKKGHFILLIVALVLVTGISMRLGANNESSYTTDTITTGSVTESVSVSGFVEAKNTANLSFPTTGIVTDVMVQEGDEVTKGSILATLGSRTLVAQRNEAIATLQKAEAAYSELITGQRTEEQSQTNQSLTVAQTTYEQTLALEKQKVDNARSALLSNGLEAFAEDNNTRATAPLITGSYNCSEEGIYTITTYRSGAYSGYSYRVTGLENDADSAYIRQASPLGDCGLYIQFVANSDYGNTVWNIPVPNTSSETYTTLKNAYDLALQAEQTAVRQAKETLALAGTTATLEQADPTIFQTQQSQATIRQARAAIAAIDAQIAEKSIIAPFDGIVTTVDILPGETAGSAPIITLLAQDAFVLTARIPEIDITKVTPGQITETVFDAQADKTFIGETTFVSPLATEIDGVAYFETTITLEEVPDWIRSGLNADVDIIITTENDVLRIPTRYIITEGAQTSVLVLNPDRLKDEPVKTPIEVRFNGNNGYVAVAGLPAGTTVVSP